jgi:hypothetical protein
MKACDRCGGRGYARLKFSTVIEGVNTVAEIKKTAAYEQLQPLFEEWSPNAINRSLWLIPFSQK